jgi:anthranilate synthase component 1
MFPSGSITGAPKIRAMNIIQELEPCQRGPYTGVLGYYDSERNFGEYSILIRTIVIDKRNSEMSFHVGGGITALSDPLEELEETRLKAAKLIEAIQC